jgi:cell division transport system permease protein
LNRFGKILQAAEGAAGRVVPPSGHTARLTIFVAAAMAFLAVFVLALSLAAGRLAERWEAALADTASIRISAPADQLDAQTGVVMEMLRTTPGVTRARILAMDETRALLEPWFGPGLPIETLPLPRLIEVTTAPDRFDPDALRLRLVAETPGAVLDDHTRWRQPLVSSAERLRTLGLAAILLIAATVAAMVALAAQAALSANAQVIAVLRLIGARDAFIARAFVRRFTLRALGGAAIGAALGMIVLAFLPADGPPGAFLTGIGFQGLEWLTPVLIPPLAALTAFVATRGAARRRLRELT